MYCTSGEKREEKESDWTGPDRTGPDRTALHFVVRLGMSWPRTSPCKAEIWYLGCSAIYSRWTYRVWYVAVGDSDAYTDCTGRFRKMFKDAGSAAAAAAAAAAFAF